ncbi:hypothetical protein D3C72_1833090 [compost metagenome]
MLMVAPTGSTKPATPSDTPRLLRAHSIDTGRVPELLEVLKATASAGAMPWKKRSGLSRARPPIRPP